MATVKGKKGDVPSVNQHGVKSEIPAKYHASWSSEIKIQLTMVSLPGQGVAVNSRGFRSREIHEEIVKSSFRCSKISASSMDGTTASLLPKKQQKKRTVPVRLNWQAKGKALAASRSSIAGNEEPENLVHGFQLSQA